MKTKITAILLFVIAFVCLPTFKAEANTRIYPDLFVTVTSNSDWAITVSWDYSDKKKVVNETCFFGITKHQVEIFRNNYLEENRVRNVESDKEILTGNVKIEVGPNHSNSYGLRYTVYAEACTQHSWSGFRKNDDGVWEPYAATEAELAGLAGRYTNYVPVKTDPIKDPLNTKASYDPFINKVVLKWEKGTDIPDAYHYYRIYRSTTNIPSSATLIHSTAQGGTRTWSDTNIHPNNVYFYWVSTCYTNLHDGVVNHQESIRTSLKAMEVKVTPLNASDGLYATSVRVGWADMSLYVDEIRVERSVPRSSEKEELAVLSKNATSYRDNDAIPGYLYTYYITGIKAGSTLPTISDTGYKKPDGIISGYVKSSRGIGVIGVKVTAHLLDSIPPGAVDNPGNSYEDTTNTEGYYEIRDIYYFDKAKFEIVPSKTGASFEHIFTPEKTSRVLEINSNKSSGINFTDESVFNIEGKVTYKGEDCGVPNVEIKINGQRWGVFTDDKGIWKTTLQDEGTYSFKPVFMHHQFEPDSAIFEIVSDKSGINFANAETDSIVVKVQSGCGTPIVDSAKIEVISTQVKPTDKSYCYSQIFWTDSLGLLTIKGLPAREYNIRLTALQPDNNNIFKQIGDKPIKLNLTVRDTLMVIDTIKIETIIKPESKKQLENGEWITIPAVKNVETRYDTTRTAVVPSVNFTYFSPLNIAVDFDEAYARVIDCPNSSKSTIVMEQNESYTLNFKVTETVGNCPVQEGVLRIFDFVSDRGTSPVELPVKNGQVTYTIDAGKPEFASSGGDFDHKKLLYVMPRIGFVDDFPSIPYWILVTGVKSETSTFVTNSPDIPMLILHDPPGDQSYAYVKKGFTYSNFTTTEVLTGGEAGVYADLTFGGAKEHFKAGGVIKLTATGGKDNFNRSGIMTTITFDETFSTSSLEDFTGHDGDVYIGASFNQEFAFGKRLKFDTLTCKPSIDSILYFDNTGFNTTFIYTEHHIKNTLIPNFRRIYNTLIGDREISKLTKDENIQALGLKLQISNWEKILSNNDYNRGKKAVLDKNISFSAGADYSSEFASDSTVSNSYEFNVMVNIELAIGAKIENDLGFWAETDFGAVAKFRYSNNVNTGRDSTFRRTVGYVLSDGDIGDYFSVDIKNDVAYGVPAFDLKLGTTSCPWEPKSQKRDLAAIKVYPPEINNVPIGGQAMFYAQLTNLSESGETRSYMVGVHPTSNPDGALIRLGGHIINNSPATFTIEPNQTVTIALSVEKGPLASNYENIGLYIEPTCDLSSLTFNEGGDYTTFSVNFQSQCSNVTLHLPENNWLVNKNSNDILHVAFTGYDLNNKFLESITLQTRKEGEGWKDAITVKREMITDKFYDLAFDVSNLSNGNYSIRAAAWCGVNGGYTYSSEQSGKIDRTSMAPFGTPSPSDGFLRHGQEISVTFDKDIDCGSLNLATIKLLKPDSTEIPVTAQCYGNMLIIKPVADLFMQPELEGVLLNALVSGVRDQSGNVQEYPTRWSFLVNVSPVSWNPKEVNHVAEQTEKVVIEGILNNTATISKAFTITEWPWWVTPSVTSASVLRDNTFSVYFNATEGLKPGHYEGEVIAMVDNIAEVLVITLDLYATDINWKVNSSDFEYSMGITAQFSTDQNDLNLSDCTRDKIAAFVNGQLRGIGKITYIPEFDKYAAFINVYGIKPGDNGSLLESEAHVADLSVQDITITDNGVSSGASRFKKNNWIEFDIYATKSGTFKTELRLAATTAGKTLQLIVDGALQATHTVPVTGSLATYTTLVSQLNISKGLHKFRIYSVDAEFDLNWINFPEYHVRNASSSEIIKFRMWDGLNGIEYAAVEELTFFSDGQVGNAINPFLLHPAGGIQDMHLSKGWTWISVNKETDNMGVNRVFESITDPTSTNDITLKSQTAFAQYSSGTGWQGTLTAIDPQLGYMIYLNNHPDTLIMVGENPDKKPFTLKTKWNWIGFPSPEIGGVNDVLESLQSHTGDLLRGQYAFAEYYPIPGLWIGNLTTFEPGRGYKLFATNGGTLEMLKSAGADNLALNHEFNMTLTAAIHLGPISPSDDLILHTFIDNQLRGVCPLKYYNVLGDNMAFTMIYGDRQDIGKPVEIALYNNSIQQYITLTGPKISFEIDQIRGTPGNPEVYTAVVTGLNSVNKGELPQFEVYPNPFNNRLNITYTLQTDSHVTLTISDVSGREISRLVDMNQMPGFYTHLFDGSGLLPGIYFCTLKTGDFAKTLKIIYMK